MAARPLSDDEYGRLRRQQAQERARRGMRTFTRPEVREAVLGSAGGESKVGNAARIEQSRKDSYGRRQRRRAGY